METKEKAERKYYIYQQRTKRYVEVPEKVFREYYRFTKRERYVLQKEGKCICPKSSIMYCDCDCDICPYSAQPQNIMKNGDIFDYCEMEADIPDNESIEDDLNCRSLRALIEKVTEVYPDARRIIMLRYQGLTDSEIERVTGIRKYVFQYRIKRALQNLDFQLEDYRFQSQEWFIL